MTRQRFVQRGDARLAQAAGLLCRALVRILVCALFAFVLTRASPASGQIDNDDTGQVIPGTENITPGPGIDLSGWNTTGHQLAFADFYGVDLTNASFATSDLNTAVFIESILTNANFGNANLTKADLEGSTLANANFNGAIITGADFGSTTSTGFTANQLYSTASYASQNLSGIGLQYNDLTGWNFANQDLDSANFSGSTLTNANFTNASLHFVNLSDVDLTTANFTHATVAGNLSGSNLTGANFAGAIVAGANFSGTIRFTASQLYSTASYASRDLESIGLEGIDLTGWNFANQDLAGASLTGAKFSQAIVQGANFSSASGFTSSQLDSTASYAVGDLSGIGLSEIDLTGWNFANQNLTNATFLLSTLTNANFTNANLTSAYFYRSTLTNANFSGAIVKGADFGSTTTFFAGQLYATASYAGGDLTGIGLEYNNLTGWNFANQNLTNANLVGSTLTSANFSGAIVKGADFGGTTGFTASQLDSTASYASGDLTGIGLQYDALSGWSFANQNLTGANFQNSPLTSADFRDADLRGAIGWSPVSTTITHNTIQPDGSIQRLALLAGEKLIVRNNPIAITVTASATFDPASTLQLLLDHNWTSTIHFSAGLIPALGGTLDLEPASGFVPVAGDKFTVMTYDSATGAFSSITGTTPAPGLNYTPVYLPTSLVVIATANNDKTWGVDSDGSSSLAANWIGGVAPGGIGDSATFSTIITANRTVTLDADTAVGALTFDSPNNYTIAGTKMLRLQAAGATAAAINISGIHGNGAHTISTPITLASDLNITQNSGGVFTISGALYDAAGKQVIVSGSGVTAVTGSINLGNATSLSASGTSTLRFGLSSGAATIGTGVTATVTGGATLELAGSVSALSTGASGVNVVNNSSAAAGVLISGTNQVVGAIEGTGTTQVNAGSDLTANHIIQNALIIGGTAGGRGLVTIDASDSAGNPLGQWSGFELAGSLVSSSPFGKGVMSSANLTSIAADSTDLAVPAAGNSVGIGNASQVSEPSSLTLSLLVVGALPLLARRRKRAL